MQLVMQGYSCNEDFQFDDAEKMKCLSLSFKKNYNMLFFSLKHF